jgi:plasmid rolling circle replication initiator protein Rep
MRMSELYFEQPEIHLWFTMCEHCDEILESHQDHEDLEVTECPTCGCDDLTTGADWFPV